MCFILIMAFNDEIMRYPFIEYLKTTILLILNILNYSH